jgi:hypothetical protein
MAILIAQASTREGDRLISQPQAQVPPPAPIMNFGSLDWGLAIGICGLVGLNLWQLFKTQLNSDADLQKELIRSLLDERKLLLEALVKKT